MISHNENEDENEKYITQIRHNRCKPRYGYESTKYNMCLSMMVIAVSNT